MNRILSLIGVVLVVGCGPEPRDLETLQELRGVFMDPVDGQPYSGPVFGMDGDVKVWTSSLRNGLMDGPYERSFEHEGLGLWDKGTFKDGEKCGEWIEEGSETVTYPPCFDGLYETYYDDGQLESKTTYKDGVPDGPYERYFKDGQLRTKTTYKDGELDGPYEIYQVWDGQLGTRTTFKDGVEVGPYETYSNGKLFRKGGGTLRDGFPDNWTGPIEYYHDNGQLSSKGTDKDGERDGPIEYYHPNGQLESKTTYRDGVIEDGPFETYHDNGQLRTKTTYKDGELDGPVRFYNDDGQLLDGLSESYYENGQLQEKGTYKDGVQDGPREEYFENGQLDEKNSYKDGVRDGPSESYQYDGSMNWKGTYKDGIKCGEWYEFAGTVTYPPC